MSQDKDREALLKRANALLDKLLDHDLQYSAQTGAAQIVDDLIAALASQQAETPDENNQWIAEAKKTLDHLAGFLYRIGAPHKVNWRDWIDSAEKHLASQQAVKGEPVAWVVPCRGYNTVAYHSDKINALPVGTKLYASPPSREPQWQPIATAPKDGTDVLVMYMHIDTQVVHNAFYNHDDPDDDPAWWSYDKSEVSRVRLDGFMTPTHWMPLPPPPGTHSREGGSNDH